MPSIIPGFEYDIFISYRHKDNQGDRWVTEFVTALKRELESTFKEEINVYFDENPDDGLRETDNVDKSLEGKLKSLILIPIVSRTYCDSKSFAWRQEFLSFISHAKADEFGIDIKLANGNVCSRVLPIRIHDLDPVDKALLEKELHGVLRPVDFVYKASGVNRPLRSAEENPSKNLNHTYYRDQINKVANAVKEIIHAIANSQLPAANADRQKREILLSNKKPSSSWVKIGLVALAMLVLVLSGFYGYRTFQHKREVNAIRIGSIAIIPFENQTGKDDLNSVGQVASDFISTKLIQHQFWKVIPTQDVFRQTIYSGINTNPEAEKRISDQNHIDYLVLGHYNLINDSILLIVSVNDVAENKVLYETPIIKCIQTDPMKAVIGVEQLVLGYLMYSKNEDDLATSRPPTYNAYQEYLKGMEIWTKNNIGPGNIAERSGSEIEKHFKNAVAIDKDFLPPYFKLTELFSNDRKFNRLDSVMKILETKQDLFLARDAINFTIQKLMISKNWNALEDFLLTKTDAGTSDFRPYYLLAINALYRQNKPTKALSYLERCDLAEYDFENNPVDQLLYSVKAQALIKLKRYDEMENLSNSLNFKPVIPAILGKRWLALYYLNKKELADKEIDNYLLSTQPQGFNIQIATIAIFRASQLEGDSISMHRNYQKFIAYMNRWDKQVLEKTFLKFALGIMMFRTKDNIPEAENLLNQDLPVVPRLRRLHQLGILYAATGQSEKANEIVKELLSQETQYDNGINRYYAAKIEAELGNKEKSVEYIRQAIEKGLEYREEQFEFDADLRTLLDYPPFIELVRPKE